MNGIWKSNDFWKWVEQKFPENLDVQEVNIFENTYKLAISIPPIDIANLVNLKYLHVSNVLFPINLNSFEKLTKLEILSFYRLKSNMFRFVCFPPNLRELSLIDANISLITDSISNLANLDNLILTNNHISLIPGSISNLINLVKLNLSLNNISSIPDSIANLKKLKYIDLYHNGICTIPESLCCLNYLEELNLNDNAIIAIPDAIANMTNLIWLGLADNVITTIPYSIINLRRLQDFYYSGNYVENIHPSVTRFLDKMKNTKNIYNDSQSVHKHSIQESVKKSISNIISHHHNMNMDVLNLILHDPILDKDTREALYEYSSDKSVHSALEVTFLEVLRAVWSRIEMNDHRDTIKTILCGEMRDALCMCFTGRISRLVNCLSGFDELVVIKISDNEQIGNIVSLIRDQLENRGEYTIQTHRDMVERSLRESGYDDKIIQEWVGYID